MKYIYTMQVTARRRSARQLSSQMTAVNDCSQ
jgi:hypothetical protein